MQISLTLLKNKPLNCKISSPLLPWSSFPLLLLLPFLSPHSPLLPHPCCKVNPMVLSIPLNRVPTTGATHPSMREREPINFLFHQWMTSIKFNLLVLWHRKMPKHYPSQRLQIQSSNSATVVKMM